MELWIFPELLSSSLLPLQHFGQPLKSLAVSLIGLFPNKTQHQSGGFDIHLLGYPRSGSLLLNRIVLRSFVPIAACTLEVYSLGPVRVTRAL